MNPNLIPFPQEIRTMTTRLTSAALRLTPLLLVGASAAQASAGLELPDTLSLQRSGFGLTDGNEGIIAAGPEWRARFEDGEVEVTPALGRDADHSWPLTFSYEGVFVGGVAIDTVHGATAPAVENEQVVYHHSELVQERYGVRAEGIEQSFLVHALPTRDGELVVRGRLATELTPLPTAAGGLFFARHGLVDLGGVRVGAVTGIDASGSSVSGTVRTVDGALELVLPAEFVAQAELPILVDPLIGGEFVISNVSSDTQQPDVAYEASSDNYLAVWEIAFSSTDVNVRGRLIDSAGAFVGGIMALATADMTIQPHVASVDSADRFLLVYQRGPSIFGPWEVHAKAIDPVTGAGSNFVAVGKGDGESHVNPDVAGQATLASNDAVVVWERQDGGIHAQRVFVPSSGTPSLTGSSVPMTLSTEAHKPAITQSGGDAARFLVVWQNFFPTPEPGDHDISMSLYDINLSLLAFISLVSIGIDEEDAAVDGDGTNFLLAYETQDVTTFGFNDIHTRLIRWNGSSLEIDSAKVLAADTQDEVDPCVAWAGSEFAVAWENRDGPFLNSTVNLAWVDGSSGEMVDPTESVFGAGFHAGIPAIAARYSGDAQPPGANGDGALLVFERGEVSLPFDSDIVAQRVEAIGAGGGVVDLGGGCGNGGSVLVLSPVAIGNPDFIISLINADPTSTVALLNLAPPGPVTACGSCSFLLPGTLLAQFPIGGGASQPLPIPNQASLLGGVLEAQWAVLPTGSSPCPLFSSVALSNRLQLNIGL